MNCVHRWGLQSCKRGSRQNHVRISTGQGAGSPASNQLHEKGLQLHRPHSHQSLTLPLPPAPLSPSPTPPPHTHTPATQAKKYDRALALLIRNAWWERLTALLRSLDKTADAAHLRAAAAALRKAGQYGAAKEALLRLEDVPGLLALAVEEEKWEDAFLLLHVHPEHKPAVYGPYATWLCARDRWVWWWAALVLLVGSARLHMCALVAWGGWCGYTKRGAACVAGMLCREANMECSQQTPAAQPTTPAFLFPPPLHIHTPANKPPYPWHGALLLSPLLFGLPPPFPRHRFQEARAAYQAAGQHQAARDLLQQLADVAVAQQRWEDAAYAHYQLALEALQVGWAGPGEVCVRGGEGREGRCGRDPACVCWCGVMQLVHALGMQGWATLGAWWCDRAP
jgi:tetratricopeptide (TPR) repeat protein